MAVKIKHRRLGTSVTVDDKLGEALVKHGTHVYVTEALDDERSAQSEKQAAPIKVLSETRSSAPTPPVSNPPVKTKRAAKSPKGKRGYNRRDMQAKD